MTVRSVFPRDAVAVIYKAAPSPMTFARAAKRQWKLRFVRRTPPYVEPLMGWTADDDTLASQVELSFPSRDAAVAYARRQGLNYARAPAMRSRRCGLSARKRSAATPRACRMPEARRMGRSQLMRLPPTCSPMPIFQRNRNAQSFSTGRMAAYQLE